MCKPPLLLLSVLAASGCSSTAVLDVPLTGAARARNAGVVKLARVTCHDVAIKGSLGYVALGEHGVSVVDVSQPSSPDLITTQRDVQADVVEIGDDLLYALRRADHSWFGDDGRVEVLDLIDPMSPTPRQTRRILDGAPSAVDLSVENQRITVALGPDGLWLRGGRGQQELDLGAAAPNEVFLAVVLERDHVYTLGYRPGGLFKGAGPNRLSIFDASSGGRLGRIDLLPMGDAERATPDTLSLALAGDVLLVTDGTGVRRIGITDPERPRIEDSLVIPGAYAVAAARDVAVVCAAGDVVVLDLSEPGRILASQILDTPGHARGATIDGGVLAVADGEEGLRLYEIRGAPGE